MTLAHGSRVYADAQVLIYSVEKHPKVIECTVHPLRYADARRIGAFEAIFRHPSLELQPVTIQVLVDAVRLRAQTTRLRTPDAIHLATAGGVATLITNDRKLAGVLRGLHV